MFFQWISCFQYSKELSVITVIEKMNYLETNWIYIKSTKKDIYNTNDFNKISIQTHKKLNKYISLKTYNHTKSK